jgi:hypothetical protein
MRQVDLRRQILSGGQVDMRVVEAGEHCLPVEIDDPSLGARRLHHARIAPDRDEAPVADRGGLRGRELRIDGDDMRVADNQVRGRLPHRRGAQQDDDRCHYAFP